jgi:succinate-acetate transporter protein
VEPPERPGLLGRLGSRSAHRHGQDDGEEAPESDSTVPATRDEPASVEPSRAEDDPPAAASRAPRPRADARDSPPLSTIADPAPLGLAALALTLLVLSLFNAELLPAAGRPVVFGLAFAYGGLAQLLAGMWAFRTPNTFAATAFVSYGAFWISFALLQAFFADDVGAAEVDLYLGWTLIAWALFTTGLYAVSVKITGRVNVVFLLLGATLFLLGIGEVAEAEIVTRVGGYVGIVTALAAGYAAFAILAGRAVGQKVLPVREIYQSD